MRPVAECCRDLPPLVGLPHSELLLVGPAEVIIWHASAIAGDEIVNITLSFGDREYWQGIVALLGLTLAWNLVGYWLLRRGVPTFLELTSRDATEVPPAPAPHPVASSGHQTRPMTHPIT